MTYFKQPRFATTALALALSPMAALSQPVLEEVIVTAQKRAESLQDVPISVSAMSGDKINDIAITDLQELPLYVPTSISTRARPSPTCSSAVWVPAPMPASTTRIWARRGKPSPSRHLRG